MKALSLSRLARALAWSAAIVLIGACRNETSTDLEGRVPGSAGIPRRIASLAPHLTEILAALSVPAGDVVAVAGTSGLADPSEGIRAVHLGPVSDPDLVALVAARPDLVLLPPNGAIEEFLTAQGLRFEVLPMRDLDDVGLALRKIGRVLGREETARSIQAEMARDLEELGHRLRGTREVRIAIAVRRRPTLFVGGHPFLNSALRFCGVRNAFVASEEPYVAVPPDEMGRHGIEIVVDAEDGLVGERPVVEREIRWWRERSGRSEIDVEFLEGDDLFAPSPRIVRGIESLARLVHPEAYRE